MARPVGSKNKVEGAAEWRKGPVAKRLRELSYQVLEDAANGYLGYRLPMKLEDGSVKYGEWTYEQVDQQYRIAAAKELLDRTDGKAPQAITDANGGNLQFAPVIMIPKESDD